MLATPRELRPHRDRRSTRKGSKRGLASCFVHRLPDIHTVHTMVVHSQTRVHIVCTQAHAVHHVHCTHTFCRSRKCADFTSCPLGVDMGMLTGEQCIQGEGWRTVHSAQCTVSKCHSVTVLTVQPLPAGPTAEALGRPRASPAGPNNGALFKFGEICARGQVLHGPARYIWH